MGSFPGSPRAAQALTEGWRTVEVTVQCSSLMVSALQQHWRSQSCFCLSWDSRRLVYCHTWLSVERAETFFCCFGEGEQENFRSNGCIS